MATRDTGQPGSSGITRRDFLKVGAAATAVAGCGLEFAYDPAKAAAYEGQPGTYSISFTTCPYCSASCGQRVVTSVSTGEVVDIYGDFDSPWNSGGLCAKGAGSLQLVNNARRIGAWTTTELSSKFGMSNHPVPNMDGSFDNVFAANGVANDGVAYKRTGNGNWAAMDLQDAWDEFAAAMVTARGDLNIDLSGTCNSKSVAFFGSSHVNNEPNNLYRKIVANFGTSNVEHQARI